MENQNEFQEKERQEHNVMPDQENGNTQNRVFTDAGAEDEDIGPVNETEHILPDENEGDNRFMDDDEETGDPLAPDEEFDEESDEDEEMED